MESFGNFRIHLNVELLLRGQLFIAKFNFVLDPAFERFTEDGVGDIEEPLTRKARKITVFRQVLVDPGVLLGCGEDTFDGEVLILGTVQILDIVTFDTTVG